MITSAKLNQRQLVGELMDQPDLEPARHVRALRGLRRINRFTGAHAAVWRPVARLAKESGVPLRVLDLATGAGDLPIAMWQRARRSGIPLEIEGCDKSATALSFANENAERHRANIRFFELDISQQDIPEGYDVVLCSLFLHHLEDDAVIELLQKISQSVGRMLVASDLRRSYGGYWLAYWGTRLLTRSPIVHTDGPLSVRAALNVSEIRQMAESAGLQNYRIDKKWPFRYLLTWNKP